MSSCYHSNLKKKKNAVGKTTRHIKAVATCEMFFFNPKALLWVKLT